MEFCGIGSTIRTVVSSKQYGFCGIGLFNIENSSFLLKSYIIHGNLGMDDEKGRRSGGLIILVFHQK